MAKTVIWNVPEQDFVKSGGKPLVFASSGDADVYLARGAIVRKTHGGSPSVFTKITVT